LEIIPVIDVMGGKVVHAKQGDRDNYALLQSCLTQSHDPIQVMRDMLAFHPFSIIYIADLDAIIHGELNPAFYHELTLSFPYLTIYLDAGIKTKADWQTLASYSTIHPVIGSESLFDPAWLLDSSVRKSSILSLDFRRGAFLGNELLLAEPRYWSEQLIVMNLDYIGAGSGPDLNLLSEIQLKTTGAVIAAGGVRGKADLNVLEQQGVVAVLIASALHDGRLTKDEL